MLIQVENRKDAVVNLEQGNIRASTLRSEVQHQATQVSTPRLLQLQEQRAA